MARRTSYLSWLVGVCLLLLASWPTWAARRPLVAQKLFAADAVAGDFFGSSVALSADAKTALIGAWYANQAQGAAYIFTASPTGWTEQAKLVPSDLGAGDAFGYAVTLSGNGKTALISASTADQQGWAYVFTRAMDGTWTEQAKLIANDGGASDGFGSALALSAQGNIALLGASGQAGCQGAAYIFTRAADGSWTQQAKLTALDGVAEDQFGDAVALSANGKIALIGAPLWGEAETGAAYVFRSSGSNWGQQARLTAADGVMGDWFGVSLDLSADGRIALIGAAYSHAYTGSAYLFRHSRRGWQQQAQLTALDKAEGDNFGYPVSLSANGKIALIGAWGNDSGKGAAYIFSQTRSPRRWQQRSRLSPAGGAYEYPTDGTLGTLFGYAASLSATGTTALIGAIGSNEKGIDAGAAYIVTSRTAWLRAGHPLLDHANSSTAH
jgi:hypothetical protein